MYLGPMLSFGLDIEGVCIHDISSPPLHENDLLELCTNLGWLSFLTSEATCSLLVTKDDHNLKSIKKLLISWVVANRGTELAQFSNDHFGRQKCSCYGSRNLLGWPFAAAPIWQAVAKSSYLQLPVNFSSISIPYFHWLQFISMFHT